MPPTRSSSGPSGHIWANTFHEVTYYEAFIGPDGEPLPDDDSYALHFTKHGSQQKYARVAHPGRSILFEVSGVVVSGTLTG